MCGVQLKYISAPSKKASFRACIYAPAHLLTAANGCELLRDAANCCKRGAQKRSWGRVDKEETSSPWL